MTTMTNMTEDNSYWSNNLLDQLFDIDQLFTSNYDDSYNDDYDQHCMLTKEEYEETRTSPSSSSSSETDHNQLQRISSSTSINLPQQTLLSSLVCGVCGAPASGYNFDQITCESCKTFFRRNALRNMPNLQCRFTGSCIIDVRTRRQCTYCRLKKCFDINMRKDWIRTDQEVALRQLQKLAKEQKKLNKLTNVQESVLNLSIVARKKKRLMVKPTIQNLVVNQILREVFFGVNRNVSDNDRILLNNINNAYKLVDDQAEVLRKREWSSSPSLIEFINGESRMHESLINYYKSIPEFNQLAMRDRVLLIKFNLVKLVHLHCILVQNFEEDPVVDFYMPKWVNEDFHRRMSRTYQCFKRFVEHPLILKVTLIVFIFSMNLSAPFCTDLSNDYLNKVNIRESQDFYTTVLWRYLNCLYEEREAIRSMDIITTQILRYQKLMNAIEDAVSRSQEQEPVNQLESSLFRLTC